MADRNVCLTVVAAVVVAVRMAYIAYLGGALAEPARDQELYLRLAGSILDGRGLSFGSDENMLRVERSGDEGISGSWASDPRYVFGLGPVEEPSALVEPGYPMILAACMAVAGRVSGAVFLPNLLAQIIGALAVSEIARRLAGSRGAMLAGLSFAFYPYYVFYTANAMTEAIHAGMIPVVVLATHSAMEGRSRPSAAGLASGLLFLVRSTVLFLLPVQFAFVWRARGFRAAAGVLVSFLLCVAPWVARNAVELGSPVLLPTKGSLNLWMRNNPGALSEEGIEVPGWIEVHSTELLSYPDFSGLDGEVERSAELGRRARMFMFDNPALMAWLSVERLAAFLSPVPSSPAGREWIPGALMYAAAAGLAGVALHRYRKSSLAWLMAAVFAAYCAVHAVGHGGVRYRLPVDSVLLAAASAVVSSIWRRT